MSGPGSELYLSPDQQDALVAALNSNRRPRNSDPQNLTYTPTTQANPSSGHLDYSDESPYLDFDPDGEIDDSNFNFDLDGRMIGDLPDEDASGDHLHDKRKSVGDRDEDEEGGGKRREGDDKTSKKPGRKPLTSEPTSKRKAQNRAAQRAFRERKEKHLKDLETKVEDLEKSSDAANHENGLLRAQVERLQVELKEYRKRLSWISSNGSGRSQSSIGQSKNNIGGQSDFQFEFPKFGDLPAMSATNIFNNQKPQGTNTARSATLPAKTNGAANRSINSSSASRSNSQSQAQRQTSKSQSPVTSHFSESPQQKNMSTSVDSLTGLFSPSILEASRHASMGGYFPNGTSATRNARASLENGMVSGSYSNSSISNTDSPGSSSESQNAISSIGTSPEPSLNSPGNKLQELGLNTINEENQPFGFGKDEMCKEISRACGCAEDPIPPILNFSNVESVGFGNTNGFGTNNDISWMAQQSNGTFDPVLFGEYRDTQDNIISQDFGTFFNDAYPLPDLGSPQHNYTEVAPEAPRVDLIRQVDAAKEGEEVVPDNDKPMSCNKIWDRLQSMEKFRNGEIDIDNLCSELRAKAKCSDGGAVVDKKDVDRILGSAK